MAMIIGYLLLICSAIGLLILVIQVFSMARHVSESPPETQRLPPITILKPLCGIDDSLPELLNHFLRLDYPDYELVLGVKSKDDAAYSIARELEQQFPERVILHVQERAAGFNPKVNQLTEMSKLARGEIWVVSDSNVDVDRNYLREIACYFADEETGLVTHPVVGVDEQRLGALLDNLHMTTVALGMVSSLRIANKPIVVGKSMALRKSDLATLGGFESVRNVLAEDYVLGVNVTQQLKKKVVVARRAVYGVTQHRSVGQFFDRYRRWSVMQRRTVPVSVYGFAFLLFPAALSVLSVIIYPSWPTLLGSVFACWTRLMGDIASTRMLRPSRLSRRAWWTVILREFILMAAWAEGLFRRTIVWRGNRLVVGAGGLLSLPRKRSFKRPPNWTTADEVV